MRVSTAVLSLLIVFAGGSAMSQNAVSEKTNGKTISKKIEIRGIEFAVALPEKTAAGNSLNIVLIVKNDRKEEIA